ncbi:MAG TPA: hypothetical protein VK484_05120 [Ferruginibacter sp.]|nr:hypothetical protein [Ferruginibacter sp.]
MFGKVRITPSRASVGFSVPYEALLEANGNRGYVFVTDDKKRVKKVAVTISSITNNTAYIAEGLNGYGYVVTSGSPYLTDNAAITVAQ